MVAPLAPGSRLWSHLSSDIYQIFPDTWSPPVVTGEHRGSADTLLPEIVEQRDNPGYTVTETQRQMIYIYYNIIIMLYHIISSR